jgi:UDP:flavonoid glycosyltransferase YjiC (YdhE family)
MNELRYPKVVILAPPFLSHLSPLMALGRSLTDLGTEVTVGCTPEFCKDIREQDLEFVEVTINRNANRGVATETDQDAEERRRLKEFLDATSRGPIDTLITQACHRADDMLANPEELIERIRELDLSERPTLWIADQLSYGVTLSLHGMDAPFVTFCAPHPLTIPAADQVHTVPPLWPSVFSPVAADLARLRAVARQVEQSFTRTFNELLKRHFDKPPVARAFELVSPTAVIFNYPPFPGRPRTQAGRRLIYAGHTWQGQALPTEWEARVHRGSPRILLALGTFLSSRGDVLQRTIETIKELRPDSSVFVGAGGSTDSLEAPADDSVFIERFLPQRALLPHVDLAIHHGGVSSFTETLYTGRPMIVMPFSSDQFYVARDVEDHRLGAVLDPNNFGSEDLDRALERLTTADVRESVQHWSSIVRSRGPDYAARELQMLGGRG